MSKETAKEVGLMGITSMAPPVLYPMQSAKKRKMEDEEASFNTDIPSEEKIQTVIEAPSMTGVDLEELTLFPKLAPELRIMVWEHSFAFRRGVPLWFHQNTKNITSPSPFPSALHVNNEAIAEALKRYELCFQHPLWKKKDPKDLKAVAPGIYANFEADVFWPGKMLEDPSTIPLTDADLHNDILNLLSRKDSKRIRRLLISPEEQFLIPSIILKCLTALEELNLTTQQAGRLDQWMNYKQLELITKKKIEYEKDDGEWEDLFGEHQRHNRRGDRVHDIESFLKLKVALIRSSGVTFNFGWLQGIGSVPQPSVPAVSKTTRDAKRASKNFSRIRTGCTQCRYITYTEPGMWCWTCMAYSDIEYQPYPHHHVQSATKQPPSAPDSLDSGRANQLNPVSETSRIYKPTTLLHLSPWDAYRNFMNQFAPYSEAGIVGIVESDSQLIPAKRAELECALHRFHAYRELLAACCPCFRCGRTRGEAVEARWAREAQDAEEAQKIALEERNLGNSGGEATINSPYHGDGAFREDSQGPVSPQYRQHDDGRYRPNYRHGDYEDDRRSVSPQDRYPQHRHRSDHHRGNYEDGRRSVFPQESRYPQNRYRSNHHRGNYKDERKPTTPPSRHHRLNTTDSYRPSYGSTRGRRHISRARSQNNHNDGGYERERRPSSPDSPRRHHRGGMDSSFKPIYRGRQATRSTVMRTRAQTNFRDTIQNQRFGFNNEVKNSEILPTSGASGAGK